MMFVLVLILGLFWFMLLICLRDLCGVCYVLGLGCCFVLLVCLIFC